MLPLRNGGLALDPQATVRGRFVGAGPLSAHRQSGQRRINFEPVFFMIELR
jgi:hypothetical protein